MLILVRTTFSILRSFDRKLMPVRITGTYFLRQELLPDDVLYSLPCPSATCDCVFDLRDPRKYSTLHLFRFVLIIGLFSV